MHASADNSRLRAYVGDLMTRAGGRMVICGFGLVKHSDATAQIRPYFKKRAGMFATGVSPPDQTRIADRDVTSSVIFRYLRYIKFNARKRNVVY